jgi:hypothetical protein
MLAVDLAHSGERPSEVRGRVFRITHDRIAPGERARGAGETCARALQAAGVSDRHEGDRQAR